MLSCNPPPPPAASRSVSVSVSVSLSLSLYLSLFVSPSLSICLSLSLYTSLPFSLYVSPSLSTSLSFPWRPSQSTKRAQMMMRQAASGFHNKSLWFGTTLWPFLGACAMTTKFLDNEICTFKISLSWGSQERQRFWTFLLSTPTPNHPQRCNFYFYCRLAVSNFLCLLLWEKIRGKVAFSLSTLLLSILGLATLQKIVEDFCCLKFRGFCRRFSWRIFMGTFSNKNEESAKKSGGSKIKVREKSVLPKTDPNNPAQIPH